MHATPMTLDEFETGLDRYGCDLARWPPTAATAAQRLLEASSEARRLMAEARALADLLDEAFPSATPSTRAVHERILAGVERYAAAPRPFAWLWPTAHLRPIAIAAALIPLCVGFAIGVGYQRGVSDELVSDVSLLAFAAYEEFPNGDQ